MESRHDFDAAYYLRTYPDIRGCGMDPYTHFLKFGIREGRLGVESVLTTAAGDIPFDPGKEAVLVVSHEASFTGAPILSLNIVRGLQKNFNVVSLLLGDGPLHGHFLRDSLQVAGPISQRHNAVLVNETIEQLALLHRFRFAIVNSIESAMVLEPLAKGDIPALILVHEFASYTRPRSAFRTAFFWASEVVFSTQLTYQDVISHNPELQHRTCRFLPQGRCTLLREPLHPDMFASEMSRVRAVLRPPDLPDGTIVVIGIGFVHIRKGVELFIECAARVKQAGSGIAMRFVWIGGGFDPDHDIEYSAILADQIRRAGLEGWVHFMDNTPLVEEIYRLSDMLILTSRLDPLPGVAIEAMSHRLPVICFDQTTGIAEVLNHYALSRECVVSYLDTADMADRVVEFAGSPSLRKKIGSELQTVAADYFNMDAYIRSLEELALAATVTPNVDTAMLTIGAQRM